MTRVGVGVGIGFGTGIDPFLAVYTVFDRHPVGVKSRTDKAHVAVFDSDSDSDPDSTTTELVTNFWGAVLRPAVLGHMEDARARARFNGAAFG